LATYGPEHRALFAGRDHYIERFARVLGRPDTRALILHGESGVGKSSFLSAGVIPYLNNVAIGFRFHSEDGTLGSVLFVRSTDDPAGQVAEALAAFAARPYRFKTPAGVEQAVDLAAVLAESLGIDGPVLTRPGDRPAADCHRQERVARAKDGQRQARPPLRRCPVPTRGLGPRRLRRPLREVCRAPHRQSPAR
jgi:hypothetical protein